MTHAAYQTGPVLHKETRGTRSRVQSDDAPLGPGELMRKLGVSSTTFYKYQAEGRYQRFEVPRPIGLKRYSRRLVELYLAGGAD